MFLCPVMWVLRVVIDVGGQYLMALLLFAFDFFFFAEELLNKFTINFHHGGRMEFLPDGWRYEGGVIDQWDHGDMDRMSIVELESVTRESLGYTVNPVFYVKSTTCDRVECIFTDDRLLAALS